MSEELEDRKDQIRLQLAESLLKTVPSIPDDIHDRPVTEQEKIFALIDARSEKIMELLGDKKRRPYAPRTPSGRGPGRPPRDSERFQTPQLDVKIKRKKGKEG